MKILRPDVRDRAIAALPRWISQKVPRDHQESDAAFRKRRKVVAVTSLAGAGLLGAGLSTKPGSTEFYGLTAATAATWVVGGLTSGRLHLGHIPRRDELGRPVVVPILVGVGAFGAFYAAALVSRHFPLLDRAITSVLEYAYQGSDRLVLVTTLANGAAEEVFFRGALYAAVGRQHPVATSTAVYGLATVATRNPALVLASVVMGALFGLQRRASGGIQAPMLTHLTWSVLMLRFLPPLFRRRQRTGSAAVVGSASTKADNPSSSRSTSPSST
jgi:hypothetical protein